MMVLKRIPVLTLNAVLVSISAFYLLSPTVYAYFSEVSMSYSGVPKWFAATAPARMTARIFDGYNANTPRAQRFQAQLSCFLSGTAGRHGRGCEHELAEGQTVAGPPTLKLASGQYVARFEFSSNAACAAGQARVEVVTAGRFGRVLADYAGPVAPGDRIELPFRLKVMDAALGAVEFRATGMGPCVLLTRVGWTAASAPDSDWTSRVTPRRRERSR